MRRFFILATVLALTSQAAAAATLERIRSSGTFRIGYRADAKPYSYQDEQGQPAGYIRPCMKLVHASTKTFCQSGNINVIAVAGIRSIIAQDFRY